MSDLLSTQQTFIVIAIFIWLAALSFFFWQIYSHYRRLVGKAKRDDLKTILDKQLSAMEETKEALSEVKKRLRDLESDSPNNVKKVGLVRFSPYREVGGNQSFALSLLDEELNGVVISALHSRDFTRVYAKPVVSGKETKYSLSQEEKEAVKIAKTLKSKK
jgi:hypothetical protein